MKNRILNKLFKFSSLAIMAILFCQCSPTKKLSSENKITQIEHLKKDSISNLVISKAIKDSLITPIEVSNTGNNDFDNQVNSKVDAILAKLSTSKYSGDNSYSLMYDKLKKQLLFYAQIAQTQNSKTDVKQQQEKKIIQIQKVPVYVNKPLNKWQKGLMLLGIILLAGVIIEIILWTSKKTKLWV